MKLIRLLATLAMIVAGVAVPVPASAVEFRPGPTPNQEALKGVCDIIAGKFVVQPDRRTYRCDLGEIPIVCVADREAGTTCGYEITARLWPPPVKDPCEASRGTFSIEDRLGIALCELREGVLTLQCFVYADDPNMPTSCNVGWIPSEQPMS